MIYSLKPQTIYIYPYFFILSQSTLSFPYLEETASLTQFTLFQYNNIKASESNDKVAN